MFVRALTQTPARLLGHELVLDKAEVGKHGVETEVDIAQLVGDAKVIYPKVGEWGKPYVVFEGFASPIAADWYIYISNRTLSATEEESLVIAG